MESDPDTLRRRIADLEQEVEGLRRTTMMFQLVIDALPPTIFWKNRDSVYQGCSEDFARFAGFACPTDIIGKTDYDMAWKPEEANAFRADDQEVIQTETAKLHIIETQKRADGTDTWVETNKLPLRDPTTGAVIGLVGTYENITARKQHEEAERRDREALIAQQHSALLELSTPLIPVANGVLVMPIIGTIDSLRAQQMMESLLAGIVQHKATHTILDITGVRVVDTQVAASIVRVAQAAKLLGAEIILTGIGTEIAQTLVGLGTDLGGMVTRSNLQRGIAYALRRE